MGNPNRRGPAPPLWTRKIVPKPPNPEKPPPGPSRLLAIPAELRNRIYEYTFAENAELDKPNKPSDEEIARLRTAHALILVNRQLHGEALEMYHDSFSAPPTFKDYFTARQWLNRLSEWRRRRLTSLEFRTIPSEDIFFVAMSTKTKRLKWEGYRLEEAYLTWALEVTGSPDLRWLVYEAEEVTKHVKMTRVGGSEWIVESSDVQSDACDE